VSTEQRENLDAILRQSAPLDIAFAGESAGGGLAVATLVNARDHGLPLPAAAVVMSPYADLTLAGATMDTKRAADPRLQNPPSSQPAGRGFKSRPATRKYQVKGLIAGNGRRAFHHPVPAHTPGS
jgi:acetyl esterase/lipase